MKILVLTTEPAPLPGLPTTGAGMRAWGLTFGLRSAGIDSVVLGFAADSIRGTDMPTHQIPGVETFERSELTEFIESHQPDAVVLQHWGLAADLPKLSCPLAIDLAGPHLLERNLWGSKNADCDREEKLEALAKADHVVCSGKYQRHYFLPFLMEAGFSAEETLCPVIPFSVSPSLPSSDPQRDLGQFLHSGFFLPWQNPSDALGWTLEAMDDRDKGSLLVVGGAHPSGDVSGGKYDSLIEKLESHKRATLQSVMPFDDLVKTMRKSAVGVDLFPRNLERELAFPTRSIVMMWAGLPLLHNNYDEIAPYIDQYKAGWCFDPTNKKEYKKVMNRILSHPTDVEKRSDNARQLVRENFTWDKTIEPLAAWCREPKLRENKINAPKKSIRLSGNKYGMTPPDEDSCEDNNEDKNSSSSLGKITYAPQSEHSSSNLFQQILSPVASLLALIVGIVLLVVFSLAEFVRLILNRK